MSAAGPGAELSIETKGLTKRFGHQLAVDGVDLAVPKGAVFGFLGPNGSGKTTTIRLLLGLAAATGGSIRVLGEEMPRKLKDVLPRVGALVEGPAFYPFLSGAANLRRMDAADPFASAATRRARVQSALERVGLTHAADKKVRAYSLGMKQRLGIANALLAPRELLVLDEPTNGLDPQGTREVRSLVRSLAADGATVFVSSHLLAEVEQICTHAAIMSAGRLVAQGTLAELRGAGQARIRVLTPDPGHRGAGAGRPGPDRHLESRRRRCFRRPWCRWHSLRDGRGPLRAAACRLRLSTGRPGQTQSGCGNRWSRRPWWLPSWRRESGSAASRPNRSASRTALWP